ncbi:sulfatase-like hydrolase/transferase [Roseiconus nitratireducens]|uniref:Sulfatase-like hydrolase/transferase n=1 Tax=Roseiconus nitratireducens TaxID=2605748 RepID=A0A5M6D0U4_9BACT|nr:sulfatase-like hydrolase/transferase [Roseiconus nitratireducens]KAA5541101.1 sulfatase-like hydrolase/transferase [Roseiconus nitratireducens]
MRAIKLIPSKRLLIAMLLPWLASFACAERPNVVFIISDDQGYDDFGFMGNDQVRTPNLDALARRSARFPQGYVPSSVCRPSLATLLTGLYPHEHGIHFNHPPPGFAKLTRTMDRRGYESARESAVHLIRQVPTLPRLLADAGYRCLQTGKHWEGHWRDAGFTDGMTTGLPQPGATYGNKQLANGQWVAHGNGDRGLAIGRETMQPIDRFLQDVGDTPFLIWYAPFLPHLPHNSPQRFVDLYGSDLPDHQRAYFAACSEFDASVGRLMELVRKQSADRPTLYVFVVDNGFRPDPDQPMRDGQGFNYTHRSKRSPFEAGVRTPILFAMQDRVNAATHPEPCSSVDIVPTILEACGVEVPASISGRSLWPALTGDASIAPQPVYGEIYPGDASVLDRPSADVAYRWVRDGDFKLIVSHPRGGKVWGSYGDQPQLYDLASDPDEQTNLASDPEFQSIEQELRTLLDRWWKP